MSKISLQDLSSLANEQAVITLINANNAVLETVGEDFLSRSGIAPNTMTSDLDMNSNQILNLPTPVDPTDVVRLKDMEDAIDAASIGGGGGGGGGSGTVTSVALTPPTGFAISGSPITTAGTLVLSLSSGGGTTNFLRADGAWSAPPGGGGGGVPGGSTTQVQYNNSGAFGGISGATTNGTALTLVAPILGTPASGTLTNCTLPVGGITGLGTGVATFLATPSSANLSSALTDKTGTGVNVFATSPTLVTPLLGTPTSGTLTNCTGLPVSSGISGLGTGVATALAVNTGSAGTIVLFNGALGTPSSGTLTNCTGLPLAGLASLGTGVATALAVNVGSAGAFVTFNGALGTPSSGTLTSATGLPVSTGISGLGTGVATFLATPTSANLASAITNETGSGALVFGTTPTFTTSALFPDGVVGAPGISFSGLTTTGIYRTGGNVATSIAGTKILDVGATGLGVTGDSGCSGRFINSQTIGYTGIASTDGIGMSSLGIINFYVDSVERLRITRTPPGGATTDSVIAFSSILGLGLQSTLAFSFNGDGNTGINNASADVMNLVTGGTVRTEIGNNATVVYGGLQNTTSYASGGTIITHTPTIASASAVGWSSLQVSSTLTLTGTTAVTTEATMALFVQPLITDTSAVTVSKASTVYISGPPVATGGGNLASITDAFSLKLALGNLSMPVSGYINWGNTSGTGGYGVRDNGGTIELKNSGGSWAAPGSTATLTVGTTTITGGSSGRILYNNSNVLGEMTTTGTGSVVLSASPTFTGTLNANLIASSIHTITSASAASFNVGPNGSTSPTFQVDGSTASAVTGILVKSAAAAAGVAISAISSNSIESLTLDSKGGSSSIKINSVAAANVVLGGGALATSATNGMVYLSTTSGTPTGDTTDFSGYLPFVYDTAANKLWVNTTGSTWKSVTFA